MQSTADYSGTFQYLACSSVFSTSFKLQVSAIKQQVFFNYRSEANDLALRLARQFTKHEDVIVLDQ